MSIIIPDMDVLSAYEVRQIFDTGYPKRSRIVQENLHVFAGFRSAAQRETADRKKSKFIELSKTPQSKSTAATSANVLRLYAQREMEIRRTPRRTTRRSPSIGIGTSRLFMGDGEGQDRDASGQATFRRGVLLNEAGTTGVSLKSNGVEGGPSWQRHEFHNPFIKAVNPDIVVIMSGRKSFELSGFPSEKVVLDHTGK
jgi:hypothetical protein